MRAQPGGSDGVAPSGKLRYRHAIIATTGNTSSASEYRIVYVYAVSPPAANAYAVEPWGVAVITPSLAYRTSSSPSIRRASAA